MFHPVSSRVNFPELEERVLKFWKENRIFERSVDARKGARRFVLYEGPPTANGSPGIHHVLSRVFKDIIPRYKVMKGYYAPRIAGWDTHGLPVELEVERKLGLSSKPQIEEYGIAKFNARCRESVLTYLKDWEALTERIGFWVDLEHAYVTMDNKYIESCWWALKQMWDGGLVYQGYRVTPHCPRCGTSLSSHEVALGYKDDTEDPSVYIKFKIAKGFYADFMDRLLEVLDKKETLFIKWLLESTGDKPIFLLTWTTTPWTLPGNTALAVAPDADYVLVELNNEYLILTSARVDAVGLGETRVIARLKGSDLKDLLYEPLYNPDEFGILAKRMGEPEEDEPSSASLWQGGKTRFYWVICGDFVSMDDGTGIVHIAPAYGEIDYNVGFEKGLEFVHTVDLEGKVIGTYPFAGKFVKDADKDIIADLKSRGLLFREETIRHTYPFCWRCDTPLLYYAKQTWYIRTTARKEDLLANNERINWYPEHIKYGRFGDWLRNNVDWAFSRERYWGTPLPVWRCESCGALECIGSLDELKHKAGFSGLKEPLDLHRPYVDQITFDCPRCGGKMERVPEVIDCWFDSGAMPIAQYHYPFENGTLLEDGRFPADYICEAVDQTRGWFYSLHAISTLLFNRQSFLNVICLGHILDAKGEKMSKARGNVIEPRSVIDRYGADAVRWYFFTASPPGNVRRFSEKFVGEVRGFLTTLWNVYSFFVTYANIDKFEPGSRQAAIEPAELDRWILSELNQLILDVDKSLEGYDPTEAGRKIEVFVDNLSNWYVRRSRRRFWKSENDADKLAAYSTLYECLVTLTKLLAPFIPFVVDEMYRNLVCTAFPDEPVSVHLADFPVSDNRKIDKQLMSNTRLAMKLSSLGRAARSQAGIKVRQPLCCAVIFAPVASEQEAIKKLEAQIREELNVEDLKVELVAGDKRHDFIVTTDEGHKVAIDIKVRPEGGKPYDFTSEGNYTVAVVTDISPRLAAEGMAREIVHRLQTMRRSAGFDIADHITTYYQGEPYIGQIMSQFAGYIKQETLSRELVEGIPEEGVFSESHKLGGYEVRLAVRRPG